ncbi:hypothetical protein BCV72DRAFT_312130 [Rhizopus microsporus var. microsporus]|uniref:Uncharacterized protein n=1 Tax=Rhizopus microsporus var. microsporus TaxID=86635 RepID=A0A1X0RFF3_RHIZD|nr:hypothetical protein BCV72DRAFT_312130 [Rhizopus microsporus var. microsporus]
MDEASVTSSFHALAMSTSSSLAPGDRILAVKFSVDGIGWNDLHHKTLESFVERVHTATMHAYSFSKFIFFRVLQGMNFRIQEYINKIFFLKKYGPHWSITQEAELVLNASFALMP